MLYVFLWASAYVPSKIAALQSPPLWFLVVRFGAAGALMFAIARALGMRFPRQPRRLAEYALLGILGNACYLGLTYLALHRLASGMGAIVASTNPLVLAAVAPWAMGEALTSRKALGMVLGFGGVVAVMFARAGSQAALPADFALAFLGVITSVASTIVFKKFGLRDHLFVVNAVQLLAAGLVLIPVAALAEGVPHARIDATLALSFAYLVVVLSVGASALWFWLLTHGEASRVSAFYFMTPVFGLGLSALLLREPVGVHDLFGLGAIVAGIVLVHRS